MKVYNIPQLFLNEILKNEGVILQGKIIDVKGSKITIDFGSFIGEGKWETSLPIPKKGDTLIFLIKDKKNPLVLKVIESKTHIFFEKAPEIEIINAEEKSKKEELANFIKILFSIKKQKEKNLLKEKEHQTRTVSKENKDEPLFATVIPVRVDESKSEIKLIINYETKEEIYMVSLFTSIKEIGNIKADLYYMPTKGKKIIINLQTSKKETQKLIEEKKQYLENNLKELGFNPYIKVTYNPDIGKSNLYPVKKSIIEKRV